ncbi:MAG: hypothetical protein NZ455_12720, partial [Bacteroidia bacterium]|nr:hypothetical protein [Bacteroidia bacterium]
QDSVALPISIDISKNEMNMTSLAVLNDSIWVVIANTNPVLYRFDFRGTICDSVILSEYTKFRIKPWFIHLLKSQKHILIAIANQFVFYDPNTKTCQKTVFEPDNYFIDADFNQFNFAEHKGRLVIPINASSMVNTSKNYLKQHLLALCDTVHSKLKVRKTFAERDSIYKKYNLRHLTGRYIYWDTTMNHIYVSQEAAYKIRLIDMNTYKQKDFGKPFQHLNPVFSFRSYNHTLDPYFLYNQYLWLRIESNLSKEVFVHNNMIFRTYTVAIKDTTTHRIMSKQEYKIYLKTNKRTCTSALPEIVANQVCLEQSKPYGLQIYNQNYELIYDEIMPTPFNILKIENNEIWVHGRYDETNQKYWIYRYKLEHQKP